MKRTTIRDIAAYTGMSITTVSLVLNNRPSKISEETKRRVVEAAKELNYSPNQLAVGLITKRTQTLGLIVPDISNIFFSILAKGVEQACQRAGWSVVFCNSWDVHERDMELIGVLTARGVDGIIYCMSSDSDAGKAQESYALLKKYNVPYIEIDSDYAGTARHNVFFDNEKGGYLATRYLIENGHRKIACITGPNGPDYTSGRIEGYRRALAEERIICDPDLMVEGDYTMESGYRAVEKLCTKDFTGLFAFNDMMAFGAFKAFRERGILVPGDISLVGYDDVPMCELLEVPLTSVKQPILEMGIAAAQNMIQYIETGSDEDTNVCFPPVLMERKSVRNLNQDSSSVE